MHPTDVAPGAMLAGRYRLEELVSEAPYADYLARTWHAIDSVLSRAVLIILLDADDPRTPDVLDAARHAATAADVRFLRVLDALSENGVAYVVQESVRGRTLADLVSEGPLPATPAGWLIREAAQAIGSAHAQGLAHLRLDPDSVLLTNAGTVKIRGLAVEAALRGPMVEPLHDPIKADTEGLGGLLYAALTARWPGGDWENLTSAPRAGDGTLLSPRQCRAGIPRMLDAICDRALAAEPHNGPLLNTPEELAAALTEAVGSTPPDGVRMGSFAVEGLGDLEATMAGDRPAAHNGHGSAPEGDGAAEEAAGGAAAANGKRANGSGRVGGRALQHGAAGAAGAVGAGEAASDANGPNGSVGSAGSIGADGQAATGGRHADPEDRSTAAANGTVAGGALTGGARGHAARLGAPAPADGPRRTPRHWTRVLALVVGLVLVSGVSLLAWQLVRNADGGGEQRDPATVGEQENAPEGEQGPAVGTAYDIKGAGDFDPPPDGNGEENPGDVGNIHDGDPGTEWQTMWYKGDPRFGNIKDGVGAWVDLGERRKVGSVVVDLVGSGTDVDIRAAAPDATSAPESIDGWSKVGSTGDASGQTTVKLSRPVETRFVLIWFTKLPPDAESGAGRFRGGLSEVMVRR